MEPIPVQPMREKVAAILRKAIFTGEIRPGQELTQEEIAQQLGISRMPVREAFQILERDGLLILHSHRKAVVRVMTDEEIRDHYQIRALLEGEAAARASANPESYDDIRAAHEDTEQVAQSNLATEFVFANEALHRAIWKAANSPRLASLLNLLWNGVPPHLPELLSEQLQHSVAEHRKIVDAICRGDASEARSAMEQHIMRSLHDFLIYRGQR